MLQGFLKSHIVSISQVLQLCITIWFANTTSHWVECCLMCFIRFVRPFWDTDFDYELLLLPDLEVELMAGVTSREGMLTPPRHLIQRLVFPGVLGFHCGLFNVTDLGRFWLQIFCSHDWTHWFWLVVHLVWTHWFWLLIFEFEMGLTAGATGQQGMLAPPRHLIPPLVCPGLRVCQIFRICISHGFMRLITVCYITLSFNHRACNSAGQVDTLSPRILVTQYMFFYEYWQ
jgi:hypothetical protein